MLKRLVIKNIALIEHVEIDFSKGLNILSGETGSGKSVVIESLNFVLGAKADKSLISHGQDFAFVQAEFDISNNNFVKSLLTEFDLDDDDLIIISRKLSSEGRSDIKVNGVSFTSSMLKKITAHLVDVHGQSEHFYLLKEVNQLSTLDKYCGQNILDIKNEINLKYNEYKNIKSKLDELGGNESSREIRLDILNFQIKEIEEADIKEGEEEELLDLKKKLLNQEKIVNALNTAYYALSSDGGAIDNLQTALHNLSFLSDFNVTYSTIYERLDSLKSEIDDITQDISNEVDKFDFENLDINTIENRLDVIKKINKKYGPTFNDVITFLENAKNEHDKLSNFSVLSEKLLIEESKVLKVLYSLYKKLSDVRKAGAKEFSDKIKVELNELGMSNADFQIEFNQFPTKEELNVNLNGQDDITFMFTANLGEPLKPLSKIISGGEISRFMLAVKTVTSKLQDVNTFIFDEIDTGISGKIAEVVAEKFAKISIDTQILAITHLPQITAMSDNSYLIYKKEVDNKTKSFVKMLTLNEKVVEVSRIIGGNSEDEISLRHAENLINKANQYKKQLKKS